MASNTKITETRRHQRQVSAGRRRKNRLSRRSTRSAAEIFAALENPAPTAPSDESAKTRPQSR